MGIAVKELCENFHTNDDKSYSKNKSIKNN